MEAADHIAHVHGVGDVVAAECCHDGPHLGDAGPGYFLDAAQYVRCLFRGVQAGGCLHANQGEGVRQGIVNLRGNAVAFQQPGFTHRLAFPGDFCCAV